MTPTRRTPGTSQKVFRRPRRPRPFPLGLYQSAVGKKWVMGITGIMLMGFVLVHMIGNLHVYQSPTEINEYGEALRDLGGHLVPRTVVLWVMRVGLIAAFGLHIHAAYGLTRINRKARPEGYAGSRDYVAANFASRTMRWTGVIVLLYLLFHLADLTWGWLLGDEFIRGDVYHNLVASLSRIPVALIYIAANIALAVHLYHGAWSLFQSLGLNNPKFNAARRTFASGFAALILVGNLSFPLLTMAGLISEDNRTTPLADEIHSAQTAKE
ncbi:MAG: succinate dehydrogenase cytochrome b subunit [Acidimicrobiales bacterium]